MTKYTVNASILLTDRPLLERPAAVAAAGFTAVEFWWPFPVAVPADGEVEAFVRAVRDAGVQLTGLNFFAGDMPAGERGVLSHPDRAAEFRANVDLAINIGEALGCGAFNALYGLRSDDVSADVADQTATENLTYAAAAAERIGATVLVEPVSGAPAYPLLTAADALAVVDRVRATGVGAIGLLADFYHLAVNGDDVAAVIAGHAAEFAHVQIADAPGRGAPGSGDLPLTDWIDAAERAGYDGWVGLEYKCEDTDPFAWLPRGQRGRPA